MKNYKKHIDAFIREKAGRSSQTPPSHIWENLDRQLDSLPAAKPPVSYRWLRYFAILSLVLLLSVPAVRKMAGYSPAATETAATGKDQTGTPSASALAAVSNPETRAAVQSAVTNPVATQAAAPQSGAQNTSPGSSSGNTTPNGQQQAAASQPSGSAATTGDAANRSSSPTIASKTAKNNGTKTTHTPKKVKHGSYSDSYADNPLKPNVTPRVKHSRYSTAIAANTTAGKTHKTKEQKYTAPASGHNYAAAANDETLAQNKLLSSSPGSANINAGPNPGNEPINTTTTTNTSSSTQPQKAPPTATKPKEPTPPAAKKEIAKKPEEKKHKKATPPDQRWEGGVKAGYELGFTNSAASKYVVSPYLQYNITSKLSLLVQPAAKYAQLSSHSVGKDATYYEVNDDGVVTPVSGSTTNYTYTVSHDSIIKSYTYRGSYMEFELPILIKYYLTKRASIFGGINLLYSMQPGITENTYEKSNINQTINFTSNTPDPVAPDVSYPGTPYTTYNGPLYQAPTTGQFHICYMAGFSYEVGRKWLFDALVEQSPVVTNTVGGYNVNAPLSQMYFRLSAGYKFKKSAKKNNPFGHMDTGRGD